MNWKATIIFICIFLAGAIAGGFIGLRFACVRPKKPACPPTQPAATVNRPVEDWSKRQQKEFIEQLAPTPEQLAKSEPIFEATQVELRRQRKLFSQNVAEIVDHRDAQLLEFLAPAQKAKYEQTMRERKEKVRKLEAERAAARGETPPPNPAAPTPPAPAATAPKSP